MRPFKENITLNIIQPNYVNDIESFIRGRRCWRVTGNVFETMSKLLIGAGSVLSFSAGVYQNSNLSFLAGTISTVSVVSLQFSTFCKQQSRKSTEALNVLLKTLKLDVLPEDNDTVEPAVVLNVPPAAASSPEVSVIPPVPEAAVPEEAAARV